MARRTKRIRRQRKLARQVRLEQAARFILSVALILFFVIIPNWESIKQEFNEYVNQPASEINPSASPEPTSPSYTVQSGEKPYSVTVSEDAVKNAEASGQTSLQLINWGVPKYDEKNNAVEVNNNVPFFEKEDLTPEAYEFYTPLDSLGRCGIAEGVIGAELFPKDDREDISSVHPTGWWEMKNSAPDVKRARCHLIAFMLAGENANEKNLITGSHDYFNLGMLPYESKVHDYVSSTANHVRYRVTPVFDEKGILARGVLMEAKSVEDDGLQFCVFIYNAVPGYDVNYETGVWTKK